MERLRIIDEFTLEKEIELSDRLRLIKIVGPCTKFRAKGKSSNLSYKFSNGMESPLIECTRKKYVYKKLLPS